MSMSFNIKLLHMDGENIDLLDGLPTVREIHYRRDHVLIVTTKEEYHDVSASAGLKAFIVDHEDLIRRLPTFERTQIRQLLYLNPTKAAAIAIDIDRVLAARIIDLNAEVEIMVCITDE